MKANIKFQIANIKNWLAGTILLLAGTAEAATSMPLPSLRFGVGEAQSPRDVMLTLQILGLLTILSLVPAILVLMTSFTRIVVVFAFLRQALGSQQIPSNQILVGLALFMTFFIMRPVGEKIWADAGKPYLEGRLKGAEALPKAAAPLRDFMFRQTREKDLALFVFLSKGPRPKNREEIPTLTLIPAFVVSELRTAFEIGFVLYLPFLIIDMVVASTLMSMGMMMLPPVMISLPFKLLLFVLVDGWNLIVRQLALSFHL